MKVHDAHTILTRDTTLDVGKFYGQTSGLGLGAGLIYSPVNFPNFDKESQLFDTLSGPVYVLTHECDVATDNNRPFNEHVIVCPLILVEDFVEELVDSVSSPDSRQSFISDIAKHRVSRIIYLPPGPSGMDYGAFAYLNTIASTHISAFNGLSPIAAVSAYGLTQVDFALTNHLLRAKSDSLSFSRN